MVMELIGIVLSFPLLYQPRPCLYGSHSYICTLLHYISPTLISTIYSLACATWSVLKLNNDLTVHLYTSSIPSVAYIQPICCLYPTYILPILRPTLSPSDSKTKCLASASEWS